MKSEKSGISVIVPCYNEAAEIVKTIDALAAVFEPHFENYEIVVVDDASTDESRERLTKIRSKPVIVIHNSHNQGYGASLKIGIEQSRYEWIAITDADGTYPLQAFAEFFPFMKDFDMVVGVRTGKKRSVPLLRRPAKWFLNRFSSYLVRRKIIDVNSGMRIFQRDIARRYWNLFPSGFSFTTTLTLATIMGNKKIKEISINYLKRIGKSKIHPIRDTYNFFLLILRITMLFNPLRVFMPSFFITLFLAFLSLARDIYNLNLSETSVTFFVFSAIILMVGLLADLINKRLPR